MNIAEAVTKQDDWPNWPVLPVKYRGADRKFRWAVGIIIDKPEDQPTIYLVNMFEGITQDKLDNADRITFESWESAEALGWRVD